jgi:hypothetical protein
MYLQYKKILIFFISDGSKERYKARLVAESYT